MVFRAAARHNRRRRNVHHRFRRRRNASRAMSLGGLASGGMLQTIGGAAVGFFGNNALPSLIPQLAQYNAGITGYLLQAGSGLALAWGLRRFFGGSLGAGALVGTGLSLLLP